MPDHLRQRRIGQIRLRNPRLRRPRPRLTADEIRAEIHHHQRPAPPHQLQHIVRHVPRVRTDGVRRAVAEDRRRDTRVAPHLRVVRVGRVGRRGGGGRACQDVAHGVDADVREVDEHAQPVHFVDEGAAGGAEAVPERLLGRVGAADGIWDEGGVGVLVVAVPGEGGVADAELVVEAEGREGVADLVEAFDGEGGDEVTGVEGVDGGGVVGGGGEVSGVLLGESMEEIDLL